MKTYRGSPAAARCYVEADRSRADDYYLAEGTGVAERYVASPEVGVQRAKPLTGEAYEAWVAGVDPDYGVPKGRLRSDVHAVRFVEVIVNGPKSWSLAAALHPDIAAAYDAAQDRAAAQIISWLAEHATTRVGPRGRQVQIPVEALEAVTVRHYTSRAGDPHRHLHLQINSRVFAARQWRGLHTVGVRDSLGGINGIGHAAVATDPAFRAALAAHGFTLDAGGEIGQLAPFVGPFSARAAQIERNTDRYETDWRQANPGREPTPVLRRSWDARAWADGRPDKVTPKPGVDFHHRWLTELAALGYRDPDTLFEIVTTPVGVRPGGLDRDQAVETVLARLAARRSAWNALDLRGEVEQLIARAGIVVDAAVRAELAEDLTACALVKCVPLLTRGGVPEHIRALTSAHVLDVEADIAGRLGVRGALGGRDIAASWVEHASQQAGRRLEDAQARAVGVLGGDRALVVIEGAAGAGKTTTLAATRELLTGRGHALVVVTPTLKAAKVAAAELGAHAGSAAWLAHQHGWRWDEHGTWTRLAPGERDPATGRPYGGPGEKAMLRTGDLVLIDEAGMLDQDTARALLTVADEHAVRVALLGDRHQLSAVSRGGVLELAHRWADPDACVTLDVVHRFTREAVNSDGIAATVPDVDYAELTTQMRTGERPGAVFDALHARGQIRLYPSEAERQAAIADTVTTAHAESDPVAVVLDTREQVAELNAAIRERLVTAGLVDDQHAVTTRSGQRIGAGDRVATRRNDRDLDVANRDTWRVTRARRDGSLSVISMLGQRVLPAAYVASHVELAYAATVHGVQGDTVATAHLVLGEHTGAASAYVGMTRGRHANTAHLIAADVADAREQWVATFGRDRADLGPDHARQQAHRAAADYAQPRPLEQVRAELHVLWTREADCRESLEHATSVRDELRRVVAVRREQATDLEPVAARYRHARDVSAQATARAEHSEAQITARADQLRDVLQAQWNAQRSAAREDATVVLAGPGRLGLKLVAVNRANETLARWAVHWQSVIADMPTRSSHIAHYAHRIDYPAAVHAAISGYARNQAEQAYPEHPGLLTAAHTAHAAQHSAWQHYSDTTARHRDQLHHHRLGSVEDPEQRLDYLGQHIASTEADLAAAHAGLARLESEPALRNQPTGYLTTEHALWNTARDAEHINRLLPAASRNAGIERNTAARHRMHQPDLDAHHHSPDLDHGPSIGR